MSIPSQKMLVIIALLMGATQPSRANQMSFEVGRDHRGFNTPFVSVKVCEPGTATCRIIDKIKLDTGSSGLRINRAALIGLKLPVLKTSAKEHITVCAGMAGGVGYLGSAARADLYLGDELASKTTFQIVDPTVPAKGFSCLPFPSDGRNGILGIGAMRSLPSGSKAFACTRERCRAYIPAANERVENVVAHLDKNNNGFIVRTPSLNSPKNSLIGEIIFGLGTASKNQSLSKLSKCSMRSDGFMMINYLGKTHYTMLDTGTFSTLLPFAQTAIASCRGGNGYLCPRSPKTLSVSLQGPDGRACANLNVTVRGYETGSETQTRDNWVLPELVTVNPLVTNAMILGMPFFFGRDVYYVVEGRNSAVGVGPLVAF